MKADTWEAEARADAESIGRALARNASAPASSDADAICAEISALREQLATMTRILGAIADALEKSR